MLLVKPNSKLSLNLSSTAIAYLAAIGLILVIAFLLFWQQDIHSTMSGMPVHAPHHPLPLMAVGIVPMGMIAVGVVPMGIIAIGIVPMGLISIGLVAMGAIAAGLRGMGLIGIVKH